MRPYFTESEREFVRTGGNLWYVQNPPGDGWDVIRWSMGGHQVVAAALLTRSKAENLLLSLVRPSSHRTSTALHHEIRRADTRHEQLFPCLV